MCLACSFPSAHGHWTEAGLVDEPAGLGTDRTLAMLRQVLAPAGITVLRVAPRGGFLVRSRSGRAARAATVDDVWPAVQALTGRVVDPLEEADPAPDRVGSS